MSKEYRETIRKVRMGKGNSFYGKKHSLASRMKISQSLKGRTAWNKGKSYPAVKGEKNPAWRGGVSSQYHKDRSSTRYKEWREAVYARDKYTCIFCGDAQGGNLEPDHIKPFAFFPELRFDVSNGRTLCKDCHMQTDTWGNKAKVLYSPTQ